MKRKIISMLILLSSLSCFAANKEEPHYLELLDKCLYIEYGTARMEVYIKNKVIRYYEMESYRKGEKLRMEFSAPATEKGRKMLSNETNLWMYLPRTSKVIKLPLKQSFMGSDASNRDLMRIAYKKDYTILKKTAKGNAIIELELEAKDTSVSYNFMILTVDTQTMTPIKQEMYSLSRKLIKTMTFEKSVKVDGIYMPSIYIITDELRKNTTTKLVYSQLKRKNDKPIEFFTLASIRR